MENESAITSFLVLLGVTTIFMLILQICVSIFLVCYAFCWQWLRRWFNKRAGVDFMPENRVDRPQSLAAAVGIGILVIMFILSLFGESSRFESYVSYAVIIVGVWYSVRYYSDCKKIVDAKAAKWMLIYMMLSCFSIMITAIIVGSWALILFVIIGALSVSGSSNGSSNNSSSSDDVNQYMVDDSGIDRKVKELGFGRYEDQNGHIFKRGDDGRISRE